MSIITQTNSKSPSIIISSIPNHAPVIARYGDGEIDVELSFRWLGAETVELVATKVVPLASGSTMPSEIAREIVSIEDAGSVGCDMQWIAKEALDGIDGSAYPVDFETAVELELIATAAAAARDEYMARAIEHNAALVAAE